MVSRLLVGLNVDGKNDWPTPVPQIGWVEVSGQSTNGENNRLHALKVPSSNNSEKTLVFVNSLLTNYRMWKKISGFFNKDYNLIFYDQRGHGASTTPSSKCTMEELADDISLILDHFGVQVADGVIGVSQGGASVLNFAIRHPGRSKKIVACDTQVKTPAANIKAWDDRISLARSGPEGYADLAKGTVARWFSAGADLDAEDREWLESGVVRTDVEGFAVGAAALQAYDLEAAGIVEALKARGEGEVLLVAGEMDGKLPEGLKVLGEQVGARVEVIRGGGHLPMVNKAEEFGKVLGEFLRA